MPQAAARAGTWNLSSGSTALVDRGPHSVSQERMGVGRIFSRGGALGNFSKIFLGGQKWWDLFVPYLISLENCIFNEKNNIHD